MKSTLATALALAALTGCAANSASEEVAPTVIDGTDEPGAGSDAVATPTWQDTPPPPRPEPSCLDATPSGTIEFTSVRPTELSRPGEIAVGPDDRYLFADGTYLAKYRADGSPAWTKPFGDLIATDAAGNVYVAGLFDRAIDFGTGLVEPHGYDGHAYLAKLDKDGNLLALEDELGRCGVTSVTALAVTRDGRVAISGEGLGTLVLDAQGTTVMTSPLVANGLAFDHDGHLVAVGAQGGDGYIIKLDASARELFHLTIGDAGPENTPQSVNKVAIDAGGNIIVLGWLESDALVFGRVIIAGTTPESGDLDAAFAVKLTSDGVPLWSSVHPGQEIGGLAVDPLGNVLVSTSDLGNLFPFTIPVLEKRSATGHRLWINIGQQGTGYGRALGVATDSCGKAWWAVTAMVSDPQNPVDLVPMSFHVRLAL